MFFEPGKPPPFEDNRYSPNATATSFIDTIQSTLGVIEFALKCYARVGNEGATVITPLKKRGQGELDSIKAFKNWNDVAFKSIQTGFI